MITRRGLKPKSNVQSYTRTRELQSDRPTTTGKTITTTRETIKVMVTQGILITARGITTIPATAAEAMATTVITVTAAVALAKV